MHGRGARWALAKTPRKAAITILRRDSMSDSRDEKRWHSAAVVKHCEDRSKSESVILSRGCKEAEPPQIQERTQEQRGDVLDKRRGADSKSGAFSGRHSPLDGRVSRTGRTDCGGCGSSSLRDHYHKSARPLREPESATTTRSAQLIPAQSVPDGVVGLAQRLILSRQVLPYQSPFVSGWDATGISKKGILPFPRRTVFRSHKLFEFEFGVDVMPGFKGLPVVKDDDAG
ncbi:hypothetical protein C8R45DRAFT_945568 [Mycena sanguinolenta]|nr:hypothetical protein C8R45DRAFT_945568 [Mycena sanguinolenta]